MIIACYSLIAWGGVNRAYGVSMFMEEGLGTERFDTPSALTSGAGTREIFNLCQSLNYLLTLRNHSMWYVFKLKDIPGLATLEKTIHFMCHPNARQGYSH